MIIDVKFAVDMYQLGAESFQQLSNSIWQILKLYAQATTTSCYEK